MTDRVIRLAYNFNLKEFQTLFPEIQLFNFETDKNLDIDLMVFPGGEDVTLSYYLNDEDSKRFEQLCTTNINRDNIESKILKQSLDGTLKVKKILGVCRGCQFLDVKFGGTLYPDLNTYGLKHDSVHRLEHYTPSSLRFLDSVNSLHHQGLRYTGEYYDDLNIHTFPKVIAMDETGSVIELISWMSEKILGVQFHPEYYMEQHPHKDMFRQFIYSWVANEKTLF